MEWVRPTFSWSWIVALIDDIRAHYDALSPYYSLFWGKHIHHGFWEDSENVQEAQEKLIRMLTDFSRLKPNEVVLDVGCGLGGSSLQLAREWGCSTVGISISPVQIVAARSLAQALGLHSQCEFLIEDASQSPFRDAVFDVIWSVECTEDVEEKAAFFRRMLPLLRPGGRFAIAAWTGRTNDPLIDRVCSAFLCPNLATPEQYREWIPEARILDITSHVIPTWRICRAVAESPTLSSLAGRFSKFLQGFQAIEEAFRTGKMSYILAAGQV